MASTSPKSPDLDLARRLAHLAADEAMKRFDRVGHELKADGSEVTEADRAAEHAMRELLAKEAPADAIVGEEEGGELDLSADRSWIIDPIDGTTSFVLGVPIFATLVALVERGTVTTGVIGLPGMGVQVAAHVGDGCWFFDGEEAAEQLKVQPVATLAEAYVSSTGPHFSDILTPEDVPDGTRRWGLRSLISQARKYRAVPDAMQYAWVCRGRLNVACDTAMAPWDIAAVLPCITEAGGRVTSADGAEVVLGETQSLVATSGGPLHDEVVALLRAPRLA